MELTAQLMRDSLGRSEGVRLSHHLSYRLAFAMLYVVAACDGNSRQTLRRSAGVDSGATAQGALAAAQLPICDTLRSLLGATASRHFVFVADTVVANPGGSRAPWPRRGCWLQVVDSVAPGGTQTEELERWFQAHGWRNAPYAADGPDGTMFGLFRAPELCVVKGHWDGGDDADTSYVPRPGDELTVQCVPATPSDSSRWMTAEPGP